jgi:3-deoxy-manno-octulosonate cytidylyltransferase (CMP-KDO synthetase)
MNVAIIVPARIGSTRFPKKLLHRIKDKPVIVWTADRIKKEAPDLPLYFAVDHESLADVLRRDGYEAIMTDPAHTCGTDRIAEANRRLKARYVINVQADEPLVTGGQIRQLVELIQADTEMATLGTPVRYDKDYRNPNHVKLVCDEKGYAVYFSRAPILCLHGVIFGTIRHACARQTGTGRETRDAAGNGTRAPYQGRGHQGSVSRDRYARAGRGV